MRTLVLRPLRVLRDLLGGPRNLIKKRLDKLLDYELISEKSSLSYEEQAVANTYRWEHKHTTAQVSSLTPPPPPGPSTRCCSPSSPGSTAWLCR